MWALRASRHRGCYCPVYFDDNLNNLNNMVIHLARQDHVQRKCCSCCLGCRYYYSSQLS